MRVEYTRLVLKMICNGEEWAIHAAKESLFEQYTHTFTYNLQNTLCNAYIQQQGKFP